MDVDEVARLTALDGKVLGQRLRLARLAKGLTQAELARDDISVTYMSRIESGQRRADPKLLEVLANRLGTTAQSLISGIAPAELDELRLRLDYAELALATGDGPRALEGAEAVLATAADTLPRPMLRQAQFVRARALEMSGDLEGAILQLEDIITEPPQDLLWITAHIGLSRCHRESGQLTRAIEIGEAGLAALKDSRLDGTDEAVKLAVTVAAAHHLRGDTDHAIRLCRRALEKAEQLDSDVGRAAAYWNASVFAGEKGDIEMAISLTRKALSVFDVSVDARYHAQLQQNLGMWELELDEPDLERAREHLDRAAEQFALTSSGPVDQAANHIAFGSLHLQMGEPERARQRVATALDLVGDTSPLFTAEAWVLLGEIALSEQDVDAATSAFRRAVGFLTGVGADRAAAQLWFSLGTALDELGDAEASQDAFRRAAASLGMTAPRRQARRVRR